MVRGIAVIQSDDDFIRRRFWHCVDVSSNSLDWREVSCRWDTGFRFGFGRGVHGIHMKIFVAAFVLNIQNITAVSTPKIAGDRTFVCRNRTGSVKGFVQTFHPNVSHIFVRLDERNELAVRRQLRVRDLRVSEEQLPIDERRQFLRLPCKAQACSH